MPASCRLPADVRGVLHRHTRRQGAPGPMREARVPSAGARLAAQEIKREDFPLPTLGPRLEELGAAAFKGRGFQLVRCAPGPSCDFSAP